eukprot:2461198-Pyramimonas_sp.AAC.1
MAQRARCVMCLLGTVAWLLKCLPRRRHIATTTVVTSVARPPLPPRTCMGLSGTDRRAGSD